MSPVHGNEDEVWYVFEGAHLFQIGDVEVTAGAGDIMEYA